jgi:hypothetical protein
MNTHAGWYGTLKRAKTSPSPSLMLAKERLFSITKSCIDPGSPFHATPVICTLPCQVLYAASTEDDSDLQARQPGAQNHNARGWFSKTF